MLICTGLSAGDEGGEGGGVCGGGGGGRGRGSAAATAADSSASTTGATAPAGPFAFVATVRTGTEGAERVGDLRAGVGVIPNIISEAAAARGRSVGADGVIEARRRRVSIDSNSSSWISARLGDDDLPAERRALGVGTVAMAASAAFALASAALALALAASLAAAASLIAAVALVSAATALASAAAVAAATPALASAATAWASAATALASAVASCSAAALTLAAAMASLSWATASAAAATALTCAATALVLSARCCRSSADALLASLALADSVAAAVAASASRRRCSSSAALAFSVCCFSSCSRNRCCRFALRTASRADSCARFDDALSAANELEVRCDCTLTAVSWGELERAADDDAPVRDVDFGTGNVDWRRPPPRLTRLAEGGGDCENFPVRRDTLAWVGDRKVDWRRPVPRFDRPAGGGAAAAGDVETGDEETSGARRAVSLAADSGMEDSAFRVFVRRDALAWVGDEWVDGRRPAPRKVPPPGGGGAAGGDGAAALAGGDDPALDPAAAATASWRRFSRAVRLAILSARAAAAGEEEEEEEEEEGVVVVEDGPRLPPRLNFGTRGLPPPQDMAIQQKVIKSDRICV